MSDGHLIRASRPEGAAPLSGPYSVAAQLDRLMPGWLFDPALLRRNAELQAQNLILKQALAARPLQTHVGPDQPDAARLPAPDLSGKVLPQASLPAIVVKDTPFPGLTPRQLQVLALVLTGCPSKNIAADLGISRRTVENHRAAIMQRTGATSLPALARLAIGAARSCGCKTAPAPNALLSPLR